MSERKIVVPAGMLKVARDVCARGWKRVSDGQWDHDNCALYMLETALLWLSENPMVPTLEQIRELFGEESYGVSVGAWQKYFAGWQRRMFLSPEEEIPEEEIKGLAFKGSRDVYADEANFRIREAYRRGRGSR